MPSSVVRNLDDPGAVMSLWDKIVAAQDEFVSLKKRERPERITCDVQDLGWIYALGIPDHDPDR